MSKKRIGIIAVVLIAVIAIGVIIAMNRPSYPSKDKMIKQYEKAGYQVEEMTTCGDVTGIQRIVATKGELIADFTYLKSGDDLDAVKEYYDEHYENSYIVGHRFNGNKGLVYYASDVKAWELAKISKIDVNIDPIVVK